jgi:hypothetical protein
MLKGRRKRKLKSMSMVGCWNMGGVAKFASRKGKSDEKSTCQRCWWIYREPFGDPLEE